MCRLIIALSLLVLIGCSHSRKEDDVAREIPLKSTKVVTNDYELFIPPIQEGLLILFPCFPCDAANTKTEFNIIDVAIKNNIAVLLMNFNQHLWLSEVEKEDLRGAISIAVQKNRVNANNTFIGGFSSGGNVSLLLSDYLVSIKSAIQPKGVFIVDSPIDLLALYENARKTIQKDFSAVAVQEANWMVETFTATFGVGDTALVHYKNRSPYLSKFNALNNLSHLDDMKIRLYSEPDTLWWKTNRQADYENMNAYYIEQLANDLSMRLGGEHVHYIQTVNRGYRANGDRHPHSWAIVDENELINWMLGE